MDENTTTITVRRRRRRRRLELLPILESLEQIRILPSHHPSCLMSRTPPPPLPQAALDSSNSSALHYAALYGRTGACHGLVEMGASVNSRTKGGMFTPLHFAAMNSHRETAIRLIHLGAEVKLLLLLVLVL